MTAARPAASNAAITSARSFLFVPGDRPERHAKALAAGADAVIIDLEDAVSPDAKVGAAQALADTWAALAAVPDRPPLLLRCNAVGTPWFDADLALATRIRPDGLVLPKAEDTHRLTEIARQLNTSGTPQAPVALLPLVESALGVASLRALAACGAGTRLLLGHLDLQADLGMQCSDDERELDAVRLEIVLASRLAGLPPPVDGVTVATGDADRLAADTERARRFGFTGKLCIHPKQVAGVHTAFAPSAERLDWARRVIAAVQAGGSGAIQVDGKMVDAPVIKQAQQVLAAARD